MKKNEFKKILDCFLMKPDSTTLDFAYMLHTTMGDNFIRAVNVKTKQIIGKEHVLKYGDIIELIFKKK
jgi:ribosome-binding ATPase